MEDVSIRASEGDEKNECGSFNSTIKKETTFPSDFDELRVSYKVA